MRGWGFVGARTNESGRKVVGKTLLRIRKTPYALTQNTLRLSAKSPRLNAKTNDFFPCSRVIIPICAYDVLRASPYLRLSVGHPFLPALDIYTLIGGTDSLTREVIHLSISRLSGCLNLSYSSRTGGEPLELITRFLHLL